MQNKIETYVKLFVISLLMFLFLGCYGNENINNIQSIDEMTLTDVTGKHFTNVCIDLTKFTNHISHISTNQITPDFRLDQKFNKDDIENAKIGIRFVEKMIGVKYPTNYKNLYWSDGLLTNGYLGMTIWSKGKYPWGAYIVIASELKLNDVHDLNQWKDFSLVICHEFNHAFNLNPESIVQHVIDTSINSTFNFCLSESIIDRYPFNEINYDQVVYRTVLEKYAYDVGINPPWTYHQDFNEPVSSTYIIISH